MAKELNEKNVTSMIDKILTVLEQNFTVRYNGKKHITYEHVAELIGDLQDLFEIYTMQKPLACSKLCRKR